MKETKHELIGEPIETESGRHQWARCTKSRHSQLVNLDAIEVDTDKSKAVVHISREDARKYSPKDEYRIVRSKEVTSNGGHAIIVQFEKNNEKKLIENLTN
jgi:tRNA A37 N6-isopentenylltransferase MiaA